MSSQEWEGKTFLCDGCYREAKDEESQMLRRQLQLQQERNRMLEETTRMLAERLKAVEQREKEADRKSKEETVDKQMPRQTPVAADHTYGKRNPPKTVPTVTKTAPPQKGMVEMFGDSMVKYHNVQTGLNACLPQSMALKARGESGARVNQVRRWVVREMQSRDRKPEYLAIHAAINDVSKRATDAEILRDVEQAMVEISKVAQPARCLWSGIIPVGKESLAFNIRIAELNDQIRVLALSQGWGYIDPSQFMHIVKTKSPHYIRQQRIYSDGLHLDVGGIRMLGEAVARAVRPVGNF